ncbi:chorismate mutase, partial [Tremellales sp. Uapishka_1]
MNFTSGAEVSSLLSLDHIRSQLIRLEDTIIFSLIERAQFGYNEKIYEKGAFKEVLGFEGSWLEWFLFETECFHGGSIVRLARVGPEGLTRARSAKARRFTSPDEHPFSPLSTLPAPIIPPQKYPTLLHPQSADHPSTNVNATILRFYVEHLVPGITARTDDGNYGSAATRDVEVLQALSRRIHFGMFVSESKFLSHPKDFIPHILASPPNKEALAALITKPEVERRLLVRLANKARVYGCEMDGDGRVVEIEDGKKGKIDIDEVVRLYSDWVIPLTKDVEVDYLIHRLDGVEKEQIDRWMKA